MNYHYFFHITTPNTSYHYYMRFKIVKDIDSFKNLIFSNHFKFFKVVDLIENYNF